jgi:hypothetical protein
MKYNKFIYWNRETPVGEKGKCFAHIHLMVGYNQGTIADYLEMAAELRKTFPQAKDSDIQCTHVTKSCSCEGFTLIHFNAVVEGKNYTKEGWSERTAKDMNYFFS